MMRRTNMAKLFAVLLLTLLTGCFNHVDESKIPLTEDELAYIAGHPTVTFAAEDNRPPYIFVEGDQVKGLSTEYIELIAKKTGLKFQPVKTGSYIESMDALEMEKVDVMTSIRPTPENTRFMGFTPPIAYQGGVYVFRVNTLPRSPLTTGLHKGCPARGYLVSRFPDMQLVDTVDDEEAISLLHKGLLDGVVTDAGTARYLTNKSDVQVRWASINFDFPFSFAYNSNAVTLGSILTKAISSITPEDKHTINSRWLVGTK
jgi:ABC-type amino acid transport substrate-binding protein